MTFRASHQWRTLCVVFIIFLVVCETLVYVVTTPRPRERFLQLYVLGSNQEAADYYPNNDPNIHIGEQVMWYLGVTNNIGTVQFISIRVKISNQTIEPPNDTLALESPAPSIIEFERFLQDNETWHVPLFWSILNATNTGEAIHILVLEIDNQTYRISDWSATSGYNFRMIFELWTWQTNLNAFVFGWNANGENATAWLQIWFNMTSTSSPA
ncbi:MAG: DUF1616 domain-containing protein [Candidatus Bathyarchaeia archaeon]